MELFERCVSIDAVPGVTTVAAFHIAVCVISPAI